MREGKKPQTLKKTLDPGPMNPKTDLCSEEGAPELPPLPRPEDEEAEEGAAEAEGPGLPRIRLKLV